MEGDQGGELGDIIRASSGCGGPPGTSHQMITSEWQLPSEPVSFPSPTEAPSNGFGDPFSNLGRYPLLQELPATATFDGPCPADSIAGLAKMGTNGGDHDVSGGDGGDDGTLLAAQKILGEEMARPCSIFSRFLQISPTANKAAPIVARGTRPPPILVGGHDMMKLSSNPACCGPDHAGLQMSSSSSPRTPGIKRRKSQAKKVVCIPAPAAAGSRSSGEVVPSDLWAWRKYGQKPIKGSPYPRGYYRCSSSKGCSARKQVERSRTDPNMLVITYTSEHNHPWPTQRNALAGSTRTQPAKTNTSTSKNSPPNQMPQASGQEEHKEMTSTSTPVKEEEVEMEKATMDNTTDDHDLDHVFQQDYKAMFLESCHSGDFFADLGEFEPDPMELVFSKGFLEENPEEERDNNKPLDPFSMFDHWAGSITGETKKGGL